MKSNLWLIRPPENLISNCHDRSGNKLIERSRVDFSHFSEHKFRHNFQDTLNPIFSYGENIETTTHYLLRCCNHLNGRMTLLNDLQNFEENNNIKCSDLMPLKKCLRIFWKIFAIDPFLRFLDLSFKRIYDTSSGHFARFLHFILLLEILKKSLPWDFF